MNRREIARLDRELSAYVDELLDGMGRKERVRAMGWYITGLLLDGERKSIEPMAARLVDDAGEIQAMRQRLQQAVTVSDWSDAEIWTRLAAKVERELPGVEALVIDDTGFAKKGAHSVGVSRQYSGTLGRIDNCQVAVSLHLASERGSACAGMQLYLPESWANDPARREKAGVPATIAFKPKWQLALDLLNSAYRGGIAKHVVLADAGYGEVTDFREALADGGYSYVVGVPGAVVVWAPGTGPIPPSEQPPSRTRPRTRFQTGTQKPMSVLDLAKSLGARTCSASTTSRVEAGKAFTTTPRSARSPTGSSRSDERYSPQRRLRWTLPEVRRQLQQVLLRWIGTCPLCRRPVDDWSRPLGASRM